MKKEYIIEIKVNDYNRNFGEITDQIKDWLIKVDGIEGLTIRSKDSEVKDGK